MVHKQPSIAQQASHNAEVEVEIIPTDMLKHADAGDFVKSVFPQSFRRVAIIQLENLDLSFKACRLDTLLGQSKLIVRKRNSDSLYPVTLGGMDNEPAPAA